MMNKKAIAAFAAGATLLAGFAMATPAFALYKSDAAKATQVAKDNLTKAQNELKALEGAKSDVTAPTIAGVTLADCYTNKDGKFEPVEAKIGALQETQAQQVRKYIKDHNAHVDYTKKAAEVKTLDEAYKNAVLAEHDAADDPVSSKSSLKGNLLGAKGDFDDAVNKLEDAFAKANAAKSDLLAANANKDEKAAELTRFVTAHELAGEFDTTGLSKDEKLQLAELRNERDGAKTAASEASKAFAKLDGEVTKALTKAQGAWSVYENAFKAAKEKDSALVAGYPDPATVKPLSENYQYGLTHVTPGASHAGKPGAANKPGQQGAAGKAGAANGAAAAGAKAEVENKNGKDKRGNTHTGTGVGVTLTALAATMLAGMGAAVRKARH